MIQDCAGGRSTTGNWRLENCHTRIENMRDKDDDHEAEFRRPRRRGLIRCTDRMCGASDCPTCHPEILEPGNSSEKEEEE